MNVKGSKKVLNEKGNMSLRGKEQVETEPVNVVSLFGSINSDIIVSDPLSDLIKESEVEDELLTAEAVQPRKLVSENLFPDQSIFILEEQLQSLKSSLDRMKYYLGEIQDVLPR